MENNETSKNNKNIVIFQIGPVQEFISEARKTADFWAGSYFLSYLMSETINKAIGQGVEIIYPSVNNSTTPVLSVDSPNIPNRFVGLYGGNDINKVLSEVEKTTKGKIEEISSAILDSMLKNGTITKSFYLEQVMDSFEIYWIALPIPNESDFGKKYKQAEAIFDARKAVRDFQQMKGEEGFKCTVCGKRIPVLSDTTLAKDRSKINKEWSTLKNDFGYLIRENEALCGTCCLKRFLHIAPPDAKREYPSTASIAQAPFLEKLFSSIDKAELESFYRKLRGLNNGEYLPPGSAVPSIKEAYGDKVGELLDLDASIYYPEQYAKLPEEKVKEIKEHLDKFYRVAGTPHKYFAVVQFDGDHIGEHLRTLGTKDKLSEFSKKIFEFSQTVKNEGEKEFNIKVVYAGGDEGVIFSPLQNLFKLIKFIHDEFCAIIGNGITISIGISICHWSDPLIDAIKVSRELLELAKSSGRNSCGITVIKRSGDRLSTVYSFKKENLDFIDALLDLYLNDQISSKWYGDMLNHRNAFLYVENNKVNIDYDVLMAELKRLLERKLSKSVSVSDKKEVLKKFWDFISNLGYVEQHLDYFFDTLEIIEFVAKER